VIITYRVWVNINKVGYNVGEEVGHNRSEEYGYMELEDEGL